MGGGIGDGAEQDQYFSSSAKLICQSTALVSELLNIFSV